MNNSRELICKLSDRKFIRRGLGNHDLRKFDVEAEA